MLFLPFWGMGEAMDFGPVGEHELAEVAQLNDLFLTLVQSAVRERRPLPGLTNELRRLLRRADADGMEPLALAPRCLFEIDLPSSDSAPDVCPSDPWEAARRAFALAALFAAWKASRRSTPAGKTLFGLGADEIHALRTLAIADLLALARHPQSIRCAMVTIPGLWRGLVEDAVSRRQLSRRSILATLASVNSWRPQPAAFSPRGLPSRA